MRNHRPPATIGQPDVFAHVGLPPDTFKSNENLVDLELVVHTDHAIDTLGDLCRVVARGLVLY